MIFPGAAGLRIEVPIKAAFRRDRNHVRVCTRSLRVPIFKV